ncbi:MULTISPECIES: hypothetical protein [Exiguobacterium]|uniref:hypothetical protein n=1 Tax=Exiguobacterium sp. UBA1053 TaxID=1946487 RepID=UPI0025B8E3C0|nr:MULTISPECIES: hypothetical protein [Exiguobacterium]
MSQIGQSEGFFLDQAIHEYGHHEFKADGKLSAFDHMSVIFSLPLYEDYVAYQELGTVHNGRENIRVYRTVLTKLPEDMLVQSFEARDDVNRTFSSVVAAMSEGNERAAVASGMDFAKANARYARMIEYTFHMYQTDQVVFYHDKNLLTDELASETTRSE